MQPGNLLPLKMMPPMMMPPMCDDTGLQLAGGFRWRMMGVAVIAIMMSWKELTSGAPLHAAWQ